MSAKFLIVSRELELPFASIGRNMVTLVGSFSIKIKGENLASAFIDENFIFLANPEIFRSPSEDAIFLNEVNHLGVKIIQILKAKFWIVYQMPLSATILITPVVALTWKIYPLGVAEFVAHKVEIAVAAGRQSEKADHFMKRYATVDDKVLLFLLHTIIHFLVAETKHDGFVTNKRLIV